MRCGRVASAAAWHRCGVCLWMSFASGVQCMAQLAVGTLRLPKGAPRPVRRRSVRGHKDRPTGGLANSLWCTAAGAVLALAVQLLLCCCGASSPDPPDACAACADATRQQREIPRDKGTGDGQERCWTAGRARLSARASTYAVAPQSTDTARLRRPARSTRFTLERARRPAAQSTKSSAQSRLLL